MLDELYIKDFALINEIRIGFGSGLNIITGETGAGKSIILGALNLLMGSRASTDMIKSGAQRSIVEASFTTDKNEGLIEFLQKHAIDDDNLVIKREITVEGKGRCYINSQQVPVQLLKEIGSFLLDIHGQNEHQNILDISSHRSILDRYAGLTLFVNEFKKLFYKREELKQKLKSVSLNEDEKNRRLEILKYEIDEIEKADLKGNQEFDELAVREKVLDNAEQLIKDLAGIYDRLLGEEGNIVNELSYMEKILEKHSQYDPDIEKIFNSVQEAYYLLSDSAGEIRAKADSINYSPEEVNSIKERIDVLQNIIRKYGPTVESAQSHLEEIKNEISGIELSSDEERQLRNNIEKLSNELIERALSISETRKRVAADLEKLVQKELADLGMPDTKIRISIKWVFGPDGEYVGKEPEKKYMIQPAGFDVIEFLLASNDQDVLRPLRKIASGGEMSRIMLALKKVIIDSDPVSTMIFDEVDAGVGGRVAEMVGNKLNQLSKNAQLFVITHLHQIAGLSNPSVTHYKVIKDIQKGTRIQKLTEDQRVEELARMIGGETITKSALDHARTLLRGTA
ncbi:MAG: DNA repair protein RecN [Spirochaetia bacterium]|nr:DNA repair protein RecN [Spirochaetia bacterium]